MKQVGRRNFVAMMMLVFAMMFVTAPIFAAPQTVLAEGTTDESKKDSNNSDDKTADLNLDKATSPVVKLINSFMKPVMAIVIAAGGLFCILLGVKYTMAEEPQDREKAKSHLKNAIIGYVLIFVLLVVLNKSAKPLMEWVAGNGGPSLQ